MAARNVELSLSSWVALGLNCLSVLKIPLDKVSFPAKEKLGFPWNDRGDLTLCRLGRHPDLCENLFGNQDHRGCPRFAPHIFEHPLRLSYPAE